MGYKKCPRCELNYIKDEEEYCEVCKQELGLSGTHNAKKKYPSPFPMNITITQEIDTIPPFDGNPGRTGFKLYGDNGTEYGVVFKTEEGTDREQDRVEIRYYNELSPQYGFWHRMDLAPGNEFRWSVFIRLLKKNGIYKGFVY